MEQEKVAENGPKKTSKFSQFWGVIRKSEERSNWAYFLMVLSTFVVGYLAETGLGKAITFAFGDSNEQKLEEIKQETASIDTKVDNINRAIESIEGVPVEQLALIQSTLQEIKASAEKISPAAAGIAESVQKVDFLRGARVVSDGPYLTSGSFLLPVDFGKKDAMVLLCGVSALSFNANPEDIGRGIIKLDTPGNNWTNPHLLREPGQIANKEVSISFSDSYQPNGEIQVGYNCFGKQDT